MNTAAEMEEREDRPRTLKTFVAVGAVCTALLAIGGATKAWVILPYRMEQHDQALRDLQGVDQATARELREQRDLLLEIRGDVKALKERRGP